jgi:hypothetical protein
MLIGDAWGFEETLPDSEDSSKLNPSFVERLNLTIPQGSAYLFRRTICHARWKERLEDLELLRCHYNFVRPRRPLKFGGDGPLGIKESRVRTINHLGHCQ